MKIKYTLFFHRLFQAGKKCFLISICCYRCHTRKPFYHSVILRLAKFQKGFRGHNHRINRLISLLPFLHTRSILHQLPGIIFLCLILFLPARNK